MDGVGTAASFEAVYGIAYDPSGVLFVADGASTIRAISLSTWAVTTLAGQADVYGSADGTGTAATFGGPTGLVADAGNLYVGDTGNYTIRQIDLGSAAVTTWAGAPAAPFAEVDGTGSAARFDWPEGLAADGQRVYVADEHGDTIRAIAIAPGSTSGVVTTLAGAAETAADVDGVGSAARLYEPKWLSLSPDGRSLYVGESLTFSLTTSIRKVDLASASVTTVATVGIVVAGLAADADGQLYVSDSAFGTIRGIDVATGAVTVLAGTPGRLCRSNDGTGAAAGFCLPGALADDRAGNLYVLDNQTVRRVAIGSATVTTIAGSPGMAGSADGVGPSAQFDGPGGIVSADPSTIYVADGLFNGTLRKVLVDTGAVTTVIGQAGQQGVLPGPIATARLNGPLGLAIGPAGNLFGDLFVADLNESVILQVH
jgi:sugar lactone lactonase YvrE